MPLPDPPLLIISDRSQARLPLEEVARAAFEGGCRWFSVRERDLPRPEHFLLLRQIGVMGTRYGATVMVHGDTVPQPMTRASGVHLPSGGDPAALRRRMPHGLIGASAHSSEEAAALIAAGADYVTVSPVFLTESKPGYGPVLGLDGLAAAVAAAKGPVVALAGITPANAAACIKAGAAGVAVMGEVMRAADPEAVVRALVAAIRAA
ncbi:MAG TPA: thiamine phosphate synthase [Stellaceae bacterium]|nr:thiamine phosphate synthase [Stellaceae bacterium]